MKKALIILFALVLLATSVGFVFGASPAKVKVGLSFSDFTRERWVRDSEELKALLMAKGYEVEITEANHDAKLQNDQIAEMVAGGCKVIVILAEDGYSQAVAVDRAAKQGVKVIAYDRLVKSPNLAAYISYEYQEIGREQAKGILALKPEGNFILLGGSPTDPAAASFREGQMEILQPLIDSGKVKILADEWVDNWDPEVAKRKMKGLLAKLKGKRIDAIVASNDGTALGALEALRAAGLAGKVAISGQDATADGCRSIVKGELSFTILKDIRDFWKPTAALVDALAKGEKPGNLTTRTLGALTRDKTLEGAVPCLFLPLTRVTKDNMDQVVIASGFQSREDVYGE